MAKLSTDELLDAFKDMTLLELSEFVKKFEDTFEVTAAAPVAVAAGPAAAGAPAEVAEEVRALAVRTFEAVGCEGLARVDVFWTHDGRVVVNEINTMPGFTQHSMFPRMWAASGLDYPALVDRLVTLALQRPVGLR